MSDQQALAELQAGLERARQLHPQFAKNKKEGLKAIRCEAHELGQAIACKEGIEREKAEALDVAITAMRFYMGEYGLKKDLQEMWQSFYSGEWAAEILLGGMLSACMAAANKGSRCAAEDGKEKLADGGIGCKGFLKLKLTIIGQAQC